MCPFCLPFPACGSTAPDILTKVKDRAHFYVESGITI
jgi:hypothetical protein